MSFPRKSVVLCVVLFSAVFLPFLSSAENPNPSEDPKVLIAQGWDLVEHNDLTKGLEVFDEVLKANPANVEAKVGKARCLLYLDRLSQAQDLYKEILEVQPTNESAMIGLARAYNWQGKYELAADQYQEYLKESPNNSEAQKELAQIYQWQGDWLAAQQQYESILSDDPRNSDALRGREEVRQVLQPYQKFFANYLHEHDAGDAETNTSAYGYRVVKPLAHDNSIFGEYRMEHYSEKGKGRTLGEVALVGGKYQVNPALIVNGQADLRGYSKGAEFFSGGLVNSIWNYHDQNTLTLQYEHDLFDVLDDVRSHRYSGELKTYLLERVFLTDYFQFADLSDSNSSKVMLHSLTWNIQKRTPDLSLSVGYRNRDYEKVSPNYYSPQDLDSVFYSVYAGKNIGKTYSYVLFKFYDNNDQINDYSYLIGTEYLIKKDLSISAETSYFNNTDKYHSLGVSLALHWRF